MLALLGTLLVPSHVFADTFTSWTPGPDAVLDNTYTGFIDLPQMNATEPTGGFTVAGWFVDQTAQGWAGADDVQVWLGTMDGGGTMLAKANFAQSRPDVATALANPFWDASGFSTTVPANAVGAGQQTLSVYVHTPGKGWWFKQVAVNVSSSAAAAPAAPAAAAPTVSGGSPPTLVIESPTQGQNIPTRNPFTMMGFALDKAASITQGSQGTGIDRVQVFVDHERDNGGTFLGDADLAFSDQTAASSFGAQFANSGWRLTFKPTNLHSGVHTFFVYARSVVTGKETLETVDANIVEG